MGNDLSIGKHLAIAVWLLLPLAAHAQAVPGRPAPAPGYWVDSSGNLIRTAYNECIRAGYWTPALAIAECDPDLIPKAAPLPSRPPPPAAAPPPAPKPKPAARPPSVPLSDEDATPLDQPQKPKGQVTTTVPVFFGTTRQPLKDRRKFFSDGDSAEMSLGIAYVSIPPNHKPGRLEEKSLFSFWARPDPLKEVVLDAAPTFPRTIFFKRLRDTVSRSRDKKLLFFVHGFNNSFSESARRAGQVAFDVGMGMTPVLYSWPSRGSAVAYAADAQKVAFEGQQLTNFIADIVAESGATNFNVVAHSMGNLLLALSLNGLPQALAARGYKLEGETLPFKEIVMAAPDLEQSNFKSYVAPSLAKSGAHVSIYHSYADIALYLSLLSHQSTPVGRAGPGLPAQPAWLDSINATRQSIEGLGLYHSYFASWPVVRDLRQLFGGKRAGERSYLCRICAASQESWKLFTQKTCPAATACR